MNGRERVRNTIEHKPVDRIPVSFNPPHINDLGWYNFQLLRPEGVPEEFYQWGRHEELLRKAGGFSGEVQFTPFGNINGRLNGITKGECIRGALTDWADLDSYELPPFDMTCFTPEQAAKNKASGLYIVAGAPYSVFSVLRDARLMTNALMDVALEPENVERFLQKILEGNLKAIDCLKDFGVDAFMFFDDWGTQDRTFISPDSFRELFKPVYKAIAGRLHEYGMHLIVHSCGYNYVFMEDFVDAGIDVLQFDQFGAYGYERMAEEFAGRVTFWAPVDIQKILPTGDRELIESDALRMLKAFEGKGSLIPKDYPSYGDIAVDEEWASWARDVFMAHLTDGI